MFRTSETDAELDTLFSASRYDELATRLGALPDRSVRQDTLLGVSLLRLGRPVDAELPLLYGHVGGDPQAACELGNCLRVLGRLRDARMHFDAVLPNLERPFKAHARRWRGVVLVQLGELEAGLSDCQMAMQQFLQAGDQRAAASTMQTLAQLHLESREPERAERYLQEALRLLRSTPGSLTERSVYQSMIQLQMRRRGWEAAEHYLQHAEALQASQPNARSGAYLLSVRAALHLVRQQEGEAQTALEQLRQIATEISDHALFTWTVTELAELYSLSGQHGEALLTLQSVAPLPSQQVKYLLTRGRLARRRGDFLDAIHALEQALARALGSSAADVTAGQVSAHLALTHLQRQDVTAAREIVSRQQGVLVAYLHTLGEVSGTRERSDVQPLLMQLEEWNFTAFHDVLVRSAEFADRFELTTFGCSGLTKSGLSVSLNFRGSLVTLTHLLLCPRRTRREMQLQLYPDRSESMSSTYVRGTLAELRKVPRLGVE